MALITVTAAQIGAVMPQEAEIYDFIAAETITAGQAVYLTSAGKVGVADALTAGKQQFRGIALNGGGAGQAIGVLKRGHLFGATISIAYDALVYLSDTAGRLGDVAGTLNVKAGRVTALSDANLTKVIYISAIWEQTY